MTVSELPDKLGFTALLMCDPEREISGGYVGDLLSWVMGRAQSGDAWVTIMSNINVIAVAQLTDVACVIFAEGVLPDDNMINTARLHGINLLTSDRDSFSICSALSRIL